MLLQGCSRPECNMMEPISARDEAGKPQPLSPTPDHSIERSVGRAMGVVERCYIMYTIRRWIAIGEHTSYTENIEFNALDYLLTSCNIM